MRVKRVDAAIIQTEGQIKSQDIMGAYKTLDSALRLDPTNPILNKYMNEVRPKMERLEKERKSQLDPKEKLKEEGDTHYKNSHFELAIKSYTKCIDSLTDKVSYLFKQ